MYRLLNFGLGITMLCGFFSASAFAHEEESRVAIEAETVGPVSAGTVHYAFQLVDTKTKKVLTDKDLEVVHEKILHLIAYDPALKEFQHVHPEFDGQYWTVDLNFTVDGDYWIWAQGQIKSDGEDFSGGERLAVKDGQPTWSTPPVLGDVRSGTSGISVAELGTDKIVAGQMTMLDVKFKCNDGTQPNITPYLGAFAHIVAVPEDGDSIIHVHAMDGDNANEGMIHVTFPLAGDYRLWIQFVDGGVLKVVPLSVTVVTN